MTTPDSGIEVRALRAPGEMAALLRLGAWTFHPGQDAERGAAAKDARLAGAPGFDPTHLRGAFQGDGALVGGYNVYERVLRLGAARLGTLCVQSLVTDPSHRRRGVAGALVGDALAYARSRRHALVLLHGVPGFYARFGFGDIFDAVEVAIDRDGVLALPASGYSVRAAVPADAAALRDLYLRHYGPHPGSFDRTLEQQAYHLGHRLVLASEPSGHPAGYLLFGPDRSQVVEVACDDWPACLALLHFQARQLDVLDDQPFELRWAAPLDSPTYYLLADNLPLRSRRRSRPDAGWMVRPADLAELASGLLPAWEERWRRHRPDWTGAISLAIGGEAHALELAETGIRLLDGATADARAVSLTPGVFAQVLFGYRPVAWAAQQPGQSIPGELVRSLDVVFRPEHSAWIAGSDAF